MYAAIGSVAAIIGLKLLVWWLTRRTQRLADFATPATIPCKFRISWWVYAFCVIWCLMGAMAGADAFFGEDREQNGSVYLVLSVIFIVVGIATWLYYYRTTIHITADWVRIERPMGITEFDMSIVSTFNIEGGYIAVTFRDQKKQLIPLIFQDSAVLFRTLIAAKPINRAKLKTSGL